MDTSGIRLIQSARSGWSSACVRSARSTRAGKGKGMSTTTTIYYASDVHGSNRCFRKFLNAAKFYQANVLVMGGDILGKAIVFLEEVRSGVYMTKEHGRQIELN